MESCSVCNVELNEPDVYKTDCGHTYCYDCIVNQLNKLVNTMTITCLVCDTKIEKKSNVVDKVFISFNKEILIRLIEDKEFQKIYMLQNINKEYTNLWKKTKRYLSKKILWTLV